jgi:hypothetical protein
MASDHTKFFISDRNFESFKASGIFVDIPNITEIGAQIQDMLFDSAKETIYYPMGMELSKGSRNKFGAAAYINKYDDKLHTISIGNETVVELTKFAYDYPYFVMQHLDDENFRSLFAPLKGNRVGQFPPGMDADDCVRVIHIACLAFLFYHELGHLIQRHDLIKGSNSFSAMDEEYGFEVSETQNQMLQGKGAEVSHNLELSADFYAINASLSHLVQLFGGSNLPQLAYLLSVSAGWLIHRFSKDTPPAVVGQPSGTHPNPAPRLRYLVDAIEYFASQDLWRQFFTFYTGQTQMRSTITEAILISNLYWQSAHEQRETISTDFLKKVDFATKNPLTLRYRNIISKSWRSIRPKIVANQLLPYLAVRSK